MSSNETMDDNVIVNVSGGTAADCLDEDSTEFYDLNDMKDELLAGLQANWKLLVISLIIIIVVWYLAHVVYLYFCRIKWNQILYGPSIFLYTYHVGSYQTVDKTLNKLKEGFDRAEGKEILSDFLNVPQDELKLIPAALYVQDPTVMFFFCCCHRGVEENKLHTAIGYIIKLRDDINENEIEMEEILEELNLDFVRIRLWPKCNWILAFYPNLWWLYPIHFISYIMGAQRVFGEAAKKDRIKAPPMEIMPGSGFAKEFGGISDNVITYVLSQDHTDLYYIDSDIDLSTETSTKM